MTDPLVVTRGPRTLACLPGGLLRVRLLLITNSDQAERRRIGRSNLAPFESMLMPVVDIRVVGMRDAIHFYFFTGDPFHKPVTVL